MDNHKIFTESYQHFMLMESNLGRIVQFIQDDKRSFGVMSASRENKTDEENATNYKSLKDDVRALKLGFIELDGGYKHKNGTIVKEASLFIHSIKKKDLINLGKKYNQESVIYKSKGNEFDLIEIKSGDVWDSFRMGNKEGELDFKNVKEFFSALVKGSHKGKKFIFKSK